jgi:hypothetical protein
MKKLDRIPYLFTLGFLYIIWRYTLLSSNIISTPLSKKNRNNIRDGFKRTLASKAVFDRALGGSGFGSVHHCRGGAGGAPKRGFSGSGSSQFFFSPRFLCGSWLP